MFVLAVAVAASWRGRGVALHRAHHTSCLLPASGSSEQRSDSGPKLQRRARGNGKRARRWTLPKACAGDARAEARETRRGKAEESIESGGEGVKEGEDTGRRDWRKALCGGLRASERGAGARCQVRAGAPGKSSWLGLGPTRHTTPYSCPLAGWSTSLASQEQLTHQGLQRTFRRIPTVAPAWHPMAASSIDITRRAN